MSLRNAALSLLLCTSLGAAGDNNRSAQPSPQSKKGLPEAPVSGDKRLVVGLFAAAPDIVHPIACWTSTPRAGCS